MAHGVLQTGNVFSIQAEQERLKETLKAQEEAIREAITKEKKDKESTKERLVLQ